MIVATRLRFFSNVRAKMAANRRIKGLSSTTRALLAGGEGDEADFKKIPEGISQDDLVAFANSESGGHILVGIVERVVDGAQVGVVQGCDVSDGAILLVTNKAVTCIPPVLIEITIENLGAQPILRIAVPSSATKPHCTAKGIYNRRDGSRNRPLHPTELLRIFLENEGRVFAERFESAAERIAADLKNLESSLDTSIKNMADQLGWAESKMDDTESKLDDLIDQLQDLERPISIIGERLRTMFRQDKRHDPVSDREFKKLTQRYVEQILGRADLMELITSGGSIVLRHGAEFSQELEHEDAKKAVEIATAQILRQEDLKKYEVHCKLPDECSGVELDEFCAIVAEGGEVSAGLRSRVISALRLGFIRCDGVTVGTAGLKKPKSSYRTKVFSAANSVAKPREHPFELGWIYLREEHRSKGQMTRLIRELMPLADGKGVFATTRTSNTIMRDMLLQIHFKQDGDGYTSKLQPDETLNLFLLDRMAKG